MFQLNSFILIILLLKQAIHLNSARDVPKNNIQPQQQPSILEKNLPKEKLAISAEIQHESKSNASERNDQTIDDELEIDPANAVHQSNDLNEMINQIKEVKTFHEQLELNNDLSSFGEGNLDSSKSEEYISSTNLVTTTPIDTNVKGNLPDELERTEIPLTPEALNKNITLLEKDVEILKQIDTANMNVSKEKNSINKLAETTLNYILPKPEKVAELKLNFNERENKSIEDDIIWKNSLHSTEDREIILQEDYHSLKATENSDADKPNISNEIKAEESEEFNEENIRVEELSLWEKILLGLRCARQDCQDTFVIEAQDEQSNQQRLIKGWKITRRARRNFICPCKNILL